MDEKIFRKKSIDRVSSPEELNAYIKSTSPKLWIVLLGVIILLVGAIIWSIKGKIDSGCNVGCIVKNGEFECVVDEETYKKIENEAIIKITDNIESSAISSIEGPINDTSNIDEYILHLSNIEKNDWFYVIKGEVNEAKDGKYESFLVTERVSPIVFIIN